MTAQSDMMNKKTAILEAALNLIAVHGFHGAPTSKIAREAGAGVGSIYRYFQSKEELIHELFKHLSEKASPDILMDFDPSAPIKEQFILLNRSMFLYMIRNPKVFAFMEQYFNSPYGLTHRRDTILNEQNNNKDSHPLHAVLEKAKKNRIMKDLPLNILEALSFGPIHFLLRDIHAGLIEIDEKTINKIIEACWDSVKR
jgi:AcrR family transcriptional regulator